MKYLIPHHKEQLSTYLKTRAGETKLGERLAENWQDPSVKWVLLGIEEDIGVRVNQGIGGANTAWQAFLSAFVNIQHTDFLDSGAIGIYGCLNFDDLKEKIEPASVEIIDQTVEIVIKKIVEQGKIPIVIGGGHNNAYPIIKGVSKARQQPINAINLDAHTDFRRLEGRHSGNGFRYAFREGVLHKYAIIGLHQNYNSPLIINELAQNLRVWFCFWEDIFLTEKLSFKQAIFNAIDFTKDNLTGIELDVDSLENVLSSAMTPCGISTTQARQYLHHTAQNSPIAYLHICEGARVSATGQQNPMIGKLISYLVSDFLKAL